MKKIIIKQIAKVDKALNGLVVAKQNRFFRLGNQEIETNSRGIWIHRKVETYE